MWLWVWQPTKPTSSTCFKKGLFITERPELTQFLAERQVVLIGGSDWLWRFLWHFTASLIDNDDDINITMINRSGLREHKTDIKTTFHQPRLFTLHCRVQVFFSLVPSSHVQSVIVPQSNKSCGTQLSEEPLRLLESSKPDRLQPAGFSLLCRLSSVLIWRLAIFKFKLFFTCLYL